MPPPGEVPVAIAGPIGQVISQAVPETVGRAAARQDHNVVGGSPNYRRIIAEVEGGRMQRCFGRSFALELARTMSAGGAAWGGGRGAGGHRGMWAPVKPASGPR